MVMVPQHGMVLVVLMVMMMMMGMIVWMVMRSRRWVLRGVGLPAVEGTGAGEGGVGVQHDPTSHRFSHAPLIAEDLIAFLKL